MHEGREIFSRPPVICPPGLSGSAVFLALVVARGRVLVVLRFLECAARGVVLVPLAVPVPPEHLSSPHVVVAISATMRIVLLCGIFAVGHPHLRGKSECCISPHRACRFARNRPV